MNYADARAVEVFDVVIDGDRNRDRHYHPISLQTMVLGDGQSR